MARKRKGTTTPAPAPAQWEVGPVAETNNRGALARTWRDAFRASLSVWIDTARKAAPAEVPHLAYDAMADALEGAAVRMRQLAHANKPKDTP